MALGAYVCGWYTEIDPDLGRVVTNDVLKQLQGGLEYTRYSPVWPDARSDNGEPTKGAVIVIVDAPDTTHSALRKLPNNEVVPVDPTKNDNANIQGFLQTKGVVVDLSSATTRKDAAGRVARALQAKFQDFTGPDAAL